MAPYVPLHSSLPLALLLGVCVIYLPSNPPLVTGSAASIQAPRSNTAAKRAGMRCATEAHAQVRPKKPAAAC